MRRKRKRCAKLLARFRRPSSPSSPQALSPRQVPTQTGTDLPLPPRVDAENSDTTPGNASLKTLMIGQRIINMNRNYEAKWPVGTTADITLVLETGVIATKAGGESAVLLTTSYNTSWQILDSSQ